jgi:hypothetical protein
MLNMNNNVANAGIVMRLLPQNVLGLYSGSFYGLTGSGQLIFIRHDAGLSLAEVRSFATQATCHPREHRWELADEEPEQEFVDSIRDHSEKKYGW